MDLAGPDIRIGKRQGDIFLAAGLCLSSSRLSVSNALKRISIASSSL